MVVGVTVSESVRWVPESWLWRCPPCFQHHDRNGIHMVLGNIPSAIWHPLRWLPSFLVQSSTNSYVWLAMSTMLYEPIYAMSPNSFIDGDMCSGCRHTAQSRSWSILIAFETDIGVLHLAHCRSRWLGCFMVFLLFSTITAFQSLARLAFVV